MTRCSHRRVLALATLGLVAVVLWALAPEGAGRRDATADSPPAYVVDPFWPKPLPNAWGLGQVAGVATDARDHAWIVQRPRTLTDDEKGATLTPPRSTCCKPAPSVMEFDADGNFVQGWGGLRATHSLLAPGRGGGESTASSWTTRTTCGWPATPSATTSVLKFTRDGKFLLPDRRAPEDGWKQRHGRLLGGRNPADIEVDPGDQRSLHRRRLPEPAGDRVRRRHRRLQATLGRLRQASRGRRPALGLRPEGAPAAQTFRNPVHCVKIARDGLVYVCDRANNRIQVFQKDGTFVREFFLAEGHARQRRGVGPRPVTRPGPDLRLQRRRREQPRLGAAARQAGGRRWAGSVRTAGTPVSSTGSTTSPRTRRGTSTRRRWIRASGPRSSA